MRGVIIRNVICIFLCILLAGGLAYMIYTNNQEQEAYSAKVEALQEEAAPYENEVIELQSQLENLEEDVSYISEETKLMIGFNISGVSDIDYIESAAETYGFVPVLVIDCTMDIKAIEEIVEEADESWEIMLYASTFSEEDNASILDVLSYLETAGREQTGIFFLRSDYSSEANIQLLVDDGFIGYTSYHSDSPSAGQTEDGTVYFDYSYLFTSGTSVSSRLSALYTVKSSMIFVFDMESMNAGTLTEEYVTALLDSLEEYAQYDDCSFATVANVVEELSEINSIEAANQSEYEEQAAEIQEQIDELEAQIDEIYDKLEY